MEVGEESSYDAKFKSWVDEKIRLARARLNFPVALSSRVFERPDRRGAYRYDAPALGQGAVELCDVHFRNVEAFAMHFVVFQIGDMHGLKRPQSHVQSDLGNLDVARADLLENRRREMQTCCWRGDAAASFGPGVDRLVALAILDPVFAGDVRWQRHVTQLLDQREEIRHGTEADGSLAEISARCHLSLKLVILSKPDLLADADFLPRPHQGLPFQRAGLAGQQHFNASAQEVFSRGVPWTYALRALPRTMPEETRGKDAAVVHHQQIVSPQKVGEVNELLVGPRAAIAAEMQHTRSAAINQRLLRDQLFGKMKIEVGNQHSGDYRPPFFVCRCTSLFWKCRYNAGSQLVGFGSGASVSNP